MRDPAVAAVVLVILVTTVVSGPFVGLVDLTRADGFETTGLGEGSVRAENVSMPTAVTLSAGDFGSGAYYLEVPPATLRLESVRGQPILSYTVAIEALGFQQGTSYFLSADDQGRFEATIDRISFDPAEIQRERYDGTLTLTVRANGSERTLARSNLTVEVVE